MSKFIALVLAVCIGSADAASAQLASGYSGQPGWRQADASEYWWAVSTLGNCLYSSKRNQSLALLTSTRGSAKEAAAVKALVGKHTKCVQHLSRMSLGTVELRGTVAEAAYKASVREALPPLNLQLPSQFSRADAVRLGANRLMEQMATCVAARYPGQVHALLGTEWGSKNEAQRMEAINEPVRSCSPGRLRFSLRTSELRGLLAQAAFQRTISGQIG